MGTCGARSGELGIVPRSCVPSSKKYARSGGKYSSHDSRRWSSKESKIAEYSRRREDIKRYLCKPCVLPRRCDGGPASLEGIYPATPRIFPSRDAHSSAFPHRAEYLRVSRRRFPPRCKRPEQRSNFDQTDRGEVEDSAHRLRHSFWGPKGRVPETVPPSRASIASAPGHLWKIVPSGPRRIPLRSWQSRVGDQADIGRLLARCTLRWRAARVCALRSHAKRPQRRRGLWRHAVRDPRC